MSYLWKLRVGNCRLVSLEKRKILSVIITSLLLMAFLAPFITLVHAGDISYIYHSQWGTYGSGEGEFDTPTGVARTVENTYENFYVADRDNHRVQKFRSFGAYQGGLAPGGYGSGDGQFIRPYGVAVDSYGNVYVTDEGNNRVQKFDMHGQYITQWGGYGNGSGEFIHPYGIAVDSSDNVYVTCYNNHRVQKFTSTGVYITQWGTEGSEDGNFSYPMGIAVDSSDNIYVADFNNDRIQKFTSDGAYITQWGDSTQFSMIMYIAIDNSDNVYVSDYGSNLIQKFTNTGDYITQWGGYGSGDGQLIHPMGIAVDSNGYVYVADSGNDRVQKFEPYYTRTATLTALPNPGIQGQTTTLRTTIDPPPPSGYQYSNIFFEVTYPNAQTATFGPYSSDTNGVVSHILRLPQIGTYVIEVFSTSQVVNGISCSAFSEYMIFDCMEPPEYMPIFKWSQPTQLTSNTATDIYHSMSDDGKTIAFLSDAFGNTDLFVMTSEGIIFNQLTDTPATELWPRISGDGSKVVFVSDVDGDNEIYVINTDGSGLAQLTSNTANDIWPSISYDGSRIAYTSDVDGDNEIYLTEYNGAGWLPPTQLTTDNLANNLPYISGDGSKVTFISYMAGGGSEIRVVDYNGVGLQRLTYNPAFDYNPSINFDGSKIAFNSDMDGDNEIYVINSDGTDLKQLTFNDVADNSPVISGDGQRIVFSSDWFNDFVKFEVFVINVDGTGLTQLTTNNVADFSSKSISYDGKIISFISNKDGDFDIYIVEAIGAWTAPSKLTDNLETDLWPSISDDGIKIAFVSEEDGDSEIFVMNSDGSGKTQLTSNTATDSSACISGDGSKIAFVSDRDGDYEIFVMNSDGSNVIQLTNNEAGEANPTINDDGTKITFQSDRDGDFEIFNCLYNGYFWQGEIQLTNNDVPDTAPQISGDGSKIVYVSGEYGDDSEIVIMNLDGSSPIQLTSNEVADSSPSINDDGTRAVYVSYVDGHSQIFNRCYNGFFWQGEIQQTNNNGGSQLSPKISGDGSTITFQAYESGFTLETLELYVMDIATNSLIEPEIIQLTTNFAPDGVPSINDDGSIIAYMSSLDGDIDICVTSWKPLKKELSLDNVASWYWTGYTEISSVVEGDVDGDGSVEVVTGGWHNDGTRDVAQLCVWDGATLAVESTKTWYWTSYTYISSLAIGDVDGDGQAEIVTGGHYYDGVRDVAQLCVWDGATLGLENMATWYWTGSTEIWSLAVGDVDGDGQAEVVTGGRFNDGTRSVAQLCVWDGSSLALENVETWYWTDDTWINSVAFGNVDGDGAVEIVTGGYYNDGVRDNSQLCVWDGASLALEGVQAWFWTGDTTISSVAVGDVDGGGQAEIVTGGCFDDGVRDVAQLVVWDGASLAVQSLQTWYWTGNTRIGSVVVGDADSDGDMDVVSGGSAWDGSDLNAQLCVWSGDSLALENIQTWFWADGSWIRSVVVGDVNGDVQNEIVTGGGYGDGVRDVAQLCIWGYS
jgi:Tol biopolymer transport system component